MIHYDNIIFVDLDGTLLETKNRHYSCYRDIILKNGGIPVDLDTYWKMKRNKIKLAQLLELSQYLGKHIDFMSQWTMLIEKKEYLNFDTLKYRVSETLNTWRKIVDSLQLVTMRNNQENLLWQLDTLHIRDLFDSVICCNANQYKSKYQAVNGLTFRSAIFVGDTEEDMDTAQLLGIKSVAVINGIRCKKYLCADFYVEEIHDLSSNTIRDLLISDIAYKS